MRRPAVRARTAFLLVLCALAPAALPAQAPAAQAGGSTPAAQAGGSGSGAGTGTARRTARRHAARRHRGTRHAAHLRKKARKHKINCVRKRHCKVKTPPPPPGLEPPGGGLGELPPEAVPTPPSAAEPLRLFSATSFFNEQLPAAAPTAGDAAQIVKAFMHQLAANQGKVVINTTQWSTPVYTVGPNAPTIALAGQSSICPRPEGVFSGFRALIEEVPMPPGALPAAGSDKEVVIWQPSTGQLWELWRVTKEEGVWSACWGGRLADANTSEGVFEAPFGAAASGLSLLGGQIHLEDLEHGRVAHALELLLPDTAASEFVWPANRTDGSSKASDAIPEGTRLRLPASLDLSTLHLSPSGLAIATAIQRYGMIVGDTAGAVALSAQDPSPLIAEGRPNPYATLLPNPFDALDSVPWEDLEVISPAYRG